MLPQALEEMDQPDAQRKEADHQSYKNNVIHLFLLYRHATRQTALPLSSITAAINHGENVKILFCRPSNSSEGRVKSAQKFSPDP